MKLGAQFFSIRDNTKTPEDLHKSFKAMKEIGYDVAQMSAICPMDPYELKSYSEEFDLPIVCTHSSFDRIVNDTEALIKEHKIYNCPVIGLGGMPGEFRESREAVDKFLATVAEPMKKINAEGLKFAYHNHSFEFNDIGGITIYDYLIEKAPELTFIMDTYWVKHGGRSNEHYIKLLGSKRIADMHFKDMKEEPKGPICPCGEGVIDFKPLIKLCDEEGIVNALVEQDNAPDTGDSFGQMAISYKNLRPLF